MTSVADLHIPLLALPTSPGTNGQRSRSPLYLTVHYNGPSVPGAGDVAAELRQLHGDAQYHIDKVWGYDGGTPLHGHRIMYDYAVLSDGTIYRLGDERDLLWHCGNSLGNDQSLAVHVPVGGAQDVTDAQWAGLIRLYEAMTRDRKWPTRRCIVGHCEWPRASDKPPVLALDTYRVLPGQSPCPGPAVMRRIIQYRNTVSHVTRYRPNSSIGTNVRRAAEVTDDNKIGVLPFGQVVSGVEVTGKAPPGKTTATWVSVDWYGTPGYIWRGGLEKL